MLDEVWPVARAALSLKYPPASAFHVVIITDVYVIPSLAYLFLVRKVTCDLLNMPCYEIVLKDTGQRIPS